MTIGELSLPMLAAGPRDEAAHLPAARRLALAAVGQVSDADEAVQEAAAMAWQRLESLHEPAAFRAWFLRIVWLGHGGLR